MKRLILALVFILLPKTNPFADSQNIYQTYGNVCKGYSYCRNVIDSSLRYGVEPEMAMAVLLHESDGRINARGRLVYVSLKNGPSGYYRAVGLFQIMPFNFPKHIPRSKWYNPDVNIRVGIKHLSKCKDKFHDFRRTVSCYNMGQFNHKYNAHYVRKVLGHYRELKAKKYRRLR